MRKPIAKIAHRKWASENGWFFFCNDREIYRWMLVLGRFSIALEEKRLPLQ